MAVKIQFRRDTAAAWAATNPVLDEGEIGLDLTNNQFKIGNGTDTWNALGYWSDGNAFSKTEIVATAGQTVFRANHSGMVDVERNGFSLLTADYVLGSDVEGPKVTLTTPCEAGDVVVVRVWKTFSVADVLPLTGGSLSGPLYLPELIADSLSVTGTSHILLPRGTTASRPVEPVGGMLRYNTETLAIEGYNGEAWTGLTPGASTAPVSHPSLYATVDADIRKVWTAPDSLASKITNQTVTEDYFHTFYYWLMIQKNRDIIDPLINVNAFNNVFKANSVIKYLLKWQDGWAYIANLWNILPAAYTELSSKFDIAFFSSTGFQYHEWTTTISSSNVSMLVSPQTPNGAYVLGDLLAITKVAIRNNSPSYSAIGSFTINTGYGQDIKSPDYIGTGASYTTTTFESFAKERSIFGTVSGSKLLASAVAVSGNGTAYFDMSFVSIKAPTTSVAASANPYL